LIQQDLLLDLMLQDFYVVRAQVPEPGVVKGPKSTVRRQHQQARKESRDGIELNSEDM